jgi:hypothetical protein
MLTTIHRISGASVICVPSYWATDVNTATES